MYGNDVMDWLLGLHLHRNGDGSRVQLSPCAAAAFLDSKISRTYQDGVAAICSQFLYQFTVLSAGDAPQLLGLTQDQVIAEIQTNSKHLMANLWSLIPVIDRQTRRGVRYKLSYNKRSVVYALATIVKRLEQEGCSGCKSAAGPENCQGPGRKCTHTCVHFISDKMGNLHNKCTCPPPYLVLQCTVSDCSYACAGSTLEHIYSHSSVGTSLSTLTRNYQEAQRAYLALRPAALRAWENAKRTWSFQWTGPISVFKELSNDPAVVRSSARCLRVFAVSVCLSAAIFNTNNPVW